MPFDPTVVELLLEHGTTVVCIVNTTIGGELGVGMGRSSLYLVHAMCYLEMEAGWHSPPKG